MPNFLGQPTDQDAAARRAAAQAKLAEIEKGQSADNESKASMTGGGLGALIGGIAGGYFGGPAGAAKGAMGGYSIGSSIGGGAYKMTQGESAGAGVGQTAQGVLSALSLNKELQALKEGKMQDALIDKELKDKVLYGSNTPMPTGK